MGTQVETQTPQKTKSPAQIFSDPFERFHDEMDRLFSSYFRHLPWTKLGFGTEGGSLLANLDVSETPETVQVVLDVPGIKEKDIDVTLNDSSLTIKGKRESEVEEKKKNYHRIERSHGEFVRRIMLPCEVDRDRVDAKIKDGVLTISLQKSVKAMEREKKIPVKPA